MGGRDPTHQPAHNHVFEAERDQNSVVGLGWADGDAEGALDRGSAGLEPQRTQSPVISGQLHRFVGVQVHQAHVLVLVRQGEVAIVLKSVPRASEGGPLADDNGHVGTGAQPVEDRPRGVHMSGA